MTWDSTPTSAETSEPVSPGGSISCARHARGVTFTDQPRSYLGREAAWIVSAVLIGLLLIAMTIWRLILAARDMDSYWPAAAIIVIMMPLTAFAVILVLVDRINKGRLPTVLWTEEDRLVLMRPGLRGMHRQEWPRSQVVSLEALPQAPGANLKMLGCLRIHLRAKGYLDVFEWHPLTEIEWVARTLRPFVGPAEPPPPAANGGGLDADADQA